MVLFGMNSWARSKMKKVMLVTTNVIRRLYENLESEQKTF
jgi:hypothetical protein|tara:strand:- start:825 stop:944 length:120 start_codon:yes stop_codon:yes gene_type:complete